MLHMKNPYASVILSPRIFVSLSRQVIKVIIKVLSNIGNGE